MINFYETRMGHQFYEHDIPTLARALERLAGMTSERVRTRSIVVTGNELADMQINQFLDANVSRLIDIKVTAYTLPNGAPKKEYLIIYVPKNR